MEFNKYQTQVTEEYLDTFPDEVKEQFYDIINNIPYIKKYISPNRPYAKDLPRDNEGKIIIDITEPHILEDTDYFRPSAIHYKKYGCYTKLRPNANPNSEYYKWLIEEVRRCWHGYVRESDGEWIPGDMYFFLNYCPIQLTRKSESGVVIRTLDFPEFYDGNYYRYHYLNQCRNEGHHAMELAKRGAGKAHPYTEKVWTPEGLKLWGDIKIGDFLFGDDGNVTKVTDIPFDGIAPIYEVELANGVKVQCSEGHLWKVVHHTRKEIVVSTKELLNIYNQCYIPSHKGASFSSQHTKEDPYTIGFSCKELDNIPEEYKFNSRFIRTKVLNGAIASTGIIEGNKIELTLFSKGVMEDIKWICASLGLSYYEETTPASSTYILIIYTDTHRGNRITNIKYIGESIAKCVTVDNDSHCYLINDFIVTHNSLSAACMLAKRFILGESEEVKKKVQCVATASERKYIQGANQLLDMFQYYIDFCANNTEFPSQRLTSSLQNMQWTMGYLDVDSGTRKGTQNSVMGITSKDDESKLRGSRGVLYLLEEAGSFPRLLNLYQVLRPSVEDGNRVFGLIYGYGCCCAGTKVIKENGEPINIEDININDKLLGYDGQESTIENISWKQPIGYKECVKISTEKNNSLECSIDHPILALNKDKFGHSLRSCSFYRANELKVGDTLLIPRQVGKFGNVHEDNAFLLGALFGDGNYSNNSCVSLSISSEEEYEFYNTNYNIGISKLSKGDNTYAQIYFKGMHPLLKKYKMDKQSFSKKTLPCNIFDWDKESVCHFLGGYFNADGNVQIIKNKHRSIKLTCKYNKILIQIKQLLHKLGINSHIYKEEKQSRVLYSNVNDREYIMPNTECYVLYISNSKDILLFKDNIRLLIKAKQSRLDSYNLQCKKGLEDNLKFQLRDNNKGKSLVGKIFNNLQCVTIKSIEDIGVKEIYNITADTTHTYISNGFISSNTSGDSESDFSSMQELMYNPDGYNIKGVNNVYDKEGQGRPKFTYFYPGYLNRADCYDKDGNSDVIKAILEILQDRYRVKYNSTDINAITKRIAEIPITPQEAILRTRGNIFPITELTQRLNEIDSNPNFYDDTYVGTLVTNSKGEVEFNITTEGTPIRDFPTKDNKVVGALEIYEMPQRIQGRVPNERYIASLDNYENDESNTMSLGSMFVLDLWTDRIVAEYTGRPMFVDDLNEIARKLCIFYNAKLLYECNKKNTFAYFSKMNSLHLLADTPEYLKNKQLIKFTGFGNTSKGVNASLPVKNFGFTLIRDWLLKPVTIEKEENGEIIQYTVPNLHFIKGRALLKELMLYNPDINVDRIMSLVQLMLYREEKMILYQGDPAKNKKYDDRNSLSNDPYFSRNYDSKFSIRP